MSRLTEIISGNPEATLGGVNLLHQTSDQRNRLEVLVEGVYDVHFYSRFLNPEYLTLRSTSGCRGVVNLICGHPETVEYMIGIKDTDGEHLFRDFRFQAENLFYTDTHDMETMVMKYGPIEDIVSTLYPDANPRLNVTADLHDPLRPWSEIALYNYSLGRENALKMNLDWPRHMRLTQEEMVTDINGTNDNAGKTPISHTDVQTFAATLPQDREWDLHQGHNLCKGVSEYLKRHHKKPIDVKSITQRLIDNFPLQNFRQTNLASNLASYLATKGIDNPFLPGV